MFDPYPIASPSQEITTENRADGSALNGAGPVKPSVNVSASLSVRLSSCGLIALAMAIALSGFGYRLARYSDHFGPKSRVLVTKLWDKHQHVPQVVPSKRTAGLGNGLMLDAIAPDRPLRSRFAPAVLLPIHNVPGSTGLFRSLLPPRSPPFHSFA